MPKTIETTLTGATRLGTSYYGNPYFTLHTEDGDFRTQIDASISYSIGNYMLSVRQGADRVRLSLTRAGRVYGIDSI
jgi:hypothetical protein